MASWKDKAPTFNPYVAQQPVDAMVKVGMEKQRQYNEGYQRIQGSIDRVAGLDVVKEEDREHLQAKLDSLGTKLRTVAAGDFSNFQLTNSIAGMTSDISNDIDVQNSVNSTAAYREQQKIVKKAQKDGTLTPDNLYDYQQGVSEYFNDGEVGSAFNAEYSEHFDVFGYAKETFDAVKPDGMTYDEVFVLDARGEPVRDKSGNFIYAPAMTRIMKKGLFPEKVKQTIAQIFSDPRVSKQLNITGKYNYRGIDGEALGVGIESQRGTIVKSIDERLQQLNIDLNTGGDVQEQIDALESQRANVNSTYDELHKQSQENPDALRGRLYSDEVSSRFTTMFGQMTTEQKTMANPYWDAEFKVQKEVNDQARWAQEFQRNLNKDAQTQLNWEADHALDKQLANFKINGGIKNGTGPTGAQTTQGFESSSLDIVAMHEANYAKSVNNLKVADQELVWETQLSELPGADEELQSAMLTGLTRQEGLDLIIKKQAAAQNMTPEEYMTNAVTYSIQRGNNMSQEQLGEQVIFSNLLDKQHNAKVLFNAEKDLKNEVEEQMLKEFDDLADEESFANVQPQTLVFEDQAYDLTKRDIIDLAIVKRGTKNTFLGFLEDSTAKKAANNAEKRLAQGGKAELIEALHRDKDLLQRMQHPISTLAEAAWVDNPVAMLYREARYASERGGSTRDWSQVNKVHDVIDNEASLRRLDRKAEIINSVYNVRPNQQIQLMGGKVETNRNTLQLLGSMAGPYKEHDQNLSGDFDGFASYINQTTAELGNVVAHSIKDTHGDPQVEIVVYDEKSVRKGGMTITREQAANLNINLDNLYDTQEVRSLRLSMSTRGNKTSKNSVKKIATYVNGDVAYNKADLPQLAGFYGDVKVNIKESNGKFYPYVYIKSDGNTFLHSLPGASNLGSAVFAIKSSITPSYINTYLTEEYAKAQARNAQQ